MCSMRVFGITLVLLVMVPAAGRAKPRPGDRQLAALEAALDLVPIANCPKATCTKTREAHKRTIRRWRAEMHAAVKKGSAGCAELRSRQKGEWKITGFLCEGDVYPETAASSDSTGEPEWVVLRWTCLGQQCYLTNLRANGDESRKAGFRVRFEGSKVNALAFYPYESVAAEWLTE